MRGAAHSKAFGEAGLRILSIMHALRVVRYHGIKRRNEVDEDTLAEDSGKHFMISYDQDTRDEMCLIDQLNPAASLIIRQ